MITQTELKTFIPAIVAPCVLLFEAYTGKHIDESTQSAITNGIIIGFSFAVAIWGVKKNHQKIKPPEIIPALKEAVNIIKEVQQTTATTQKSTPIVTQADLNKQISK